MGLFRYVVQGFGWGVGGKIADELLDEKTPSEEAHDAERQKLAQERAQLDSERRKLDEERARLERERKRAQHEKDAEKRLRELKKKLGR